MMRNRFDLLRRDEQGTTAVEFAIIAPVFIALLVGTLSVRVGLFLIGSLHFVVDQGPRCPPVKPTISPGAAGTVAHAQSNYLAPSAPPPFSSAPAPRGDAGSA